MKYTFDSPVNDASCASGLQGFLAGDELSMVKITQKKQKNPYVHALYNFFPMIFFIKGGV